MLVVKNSKNPAFDAKSSAKRSKLGEEAGSRCNRSKNPGEWCLRALLGGRLLMQIGTKESLGLMTSRLRKLDAVVSPARRSQHTHRDEHANTEKKLYFNAPEVDSFDIKTDEKTNNGDGRHQLSS